MSQEFTTAQSIADLIQKEYNEMPMSTSRQHLIARLKEAHMWAEHCEKEAEQRRRYQESKMPTMRPIPT